MTAKDKEDRTPSDDKHEDRRAISPPRFQLRDRIPMRMWLIFAALFNIS
jgi:hypothetical protein